jgi:hypothetical protein
MQMPVDFLTAVAANLLMLSLQTRAIPTDQHTTNSIFPWISKQGPYANTLKTSTKQHAPGAAAAAGDMFRPGVQVADWKPAACGPSNIQSASVQLTALKAVTACRAMQSINDGQRQFR